jgi:hypothetical protein
MEDLTAFKRKAVNLLFEEIEAEVKDKDRFVT